MIMELVVGLILLLIGQEVTARLEVEMGGPAPGDLDPLTKPVSQRFHNLPRERHQLGTKCSSI